MKLLKQSEFAEKCGISKQNLQTYVKRGKIVLTTKGKINQENEVNLYFLKKHFKKVTQKKNNPQLALNLDRQIKEAELNKKLVDTRIALIKEEKMRGEVIPTEMVKILFAQHSKNIIVEFENSLDRVLTILAKEIGMNNKIISKYRGIIKNEINIAVDDTIIKTKENIVNIIEEFSEKRARGESK